MAYTFNKRSTIPINRDSFSDFRPTSCAVARSDNPNTQPQHVGSRPASGPVFGQTEYDAMLLGWNHGLLRTLLEKQLWIEGFEEGSS